MYELIAADYNNGRIVRQHFPSMKEAVQAARYDLSQNLIDDEDIEIWKDGRFLLRLNNTLVAEIMAMMN